MLFALAGGPAHADNPALCSFSSGGTPMPPSGRVAVTVHSMQLNSDMEPDVFPFDNRADVYGRVEITADGTTEIFKLAEISGNDFPHWTEDNKFVSRPATPGVPVRVVIRLDESDPGPDDTVDTSPNVTKDDLEFFVDTCSLRMTGDLTGSITDIPPIRSGNGWNQGNLSIEVAMDDYRPLSDIPNDVALTSFDLVQVLPNASRLIAGKPTVGLVTVVNNTPSPTPVSVRLLVRDSMTSAVLHDSTESLGTPLDPGEVRSFYLGAPAGFVLPEVSCGGSYQVDATASLVLVPGTEPPIFRPLCFSINNSNGISRSNVVQSSVPTLVWLRVGRLLDSGHLASPAQLTAMHDVAAPVIRGSYPLVTMTDVVAPIGFTPIFSAISEFFETLLAGLGIPADAAVPFTLVYELNAAAALAGIDRIMGALPKDWFNNTLYGLWEHTTGLSLGEWHPHAVIFETVSTDASGNVSGPKTSLPAHELGHTFGLSVDPTIKKWPCSLAGDLGVIACGMLGGFDEYNSNTHPDGVPTWGYWVPQGPIPPSMLSITGEQCNTSCMMDSTAINAHDSWLLGGRWVDAADYEQLITRLQRGCGGGFQPSIYLSGTIDDSDNAYLGWTFQRNGISKAPDFPSQRGEVRTPYGFIFLDSGGRRVGEAELPLSWNSSRLQTPAPRDRIRRLRCLPVQNAEDSTLEPDQQPALGRTCDHAQPPVARYTHRDHQQVRRGHVRRHPLDGD